ncbi:hypothetical protein S7711_05461 [Stachybotrys chartarum IBT 7711]|uniref:Mtf2-like C-terminal domain-containing protein n=1 Tax=Stachybotrys chartarum (strain CBS 109288 / IBT 7711) TaxID=1280523 RepID=A0A084BAY1_STACB|nr:hypothetical protein S7711_05461 [Stachybotrys chartarum IBT 7711]KFA46215.1 hypothetical protein S40293_07176 [Stachybotrys chartarum IBT 40293]
MSVTLLPFLYQTRTLARVLRAPAVAKYMHVSHSPRQRHLSDDSIPFHWDKPETRHDAAEPELGTITTMEAKIFKGIFEEIAQGKMLSPKRGAKPGGSAFPATTSNEASTPDMTSSSIVEQARANEFGDSFLQRYPESLRDAAQVALGKYSDQPQRQRELSEAKMAELAKSEQQRQRQRARLDKLRLAESDRVTALMKACTTDAALWKVMEEEVFSLPSRLGIVQVEPLKKSIGKPERGTKSTKAAAKSEGETEVEPESTKLSMDVHGPLYPQFISLGLELFDTAFSRSSPYVFQLLPRVKELGLPSYVLGVSTPFYARLARIHWDRFGDASSAVDVLQEMHSVGLYADGNVSDLLARIKEHMHACSWGRQGQFVMAIMGAPPYNGSLTQRLEGMGEYVRQSRKERALGMGV